MNLSRTDKRILAYEVRALRLIFEQARALVERDHGQLAALHLVLPYFETFHSCRTGESSEDRSRTFFRLGSLDVFPTPDEVRAPSKSVSAEFMSELADVLYTEARCGLFHEGKTRYRIHISAAPTALPIVVDVGSGTYILRVTIGVPAFLGRIEDHFSGYVRQLKSTADAPLREAFNQTWARLHYAIPEFFAATTKEQVRKTPTSS